jgi:hypothetical protein
MASTSGSQFHPVRPNNMFSNKPKIKVKAMKRGLAGSNN